MSGVSDNLSGIYELMYNPHYKPERSPRTALKEVVDGSKRSFILNNGTTHEYYEVDEVTAAIWGAMDGTRTAKDLHAELAKQFPHVTERDVRDTLVSLAEEGTVKGTEPEVTKSRVNAVSPFQVDVRLVENSATDLQPVYRLLRPLFKRPFLVVGIVLSLVGFAVFGGAFFQVLGNRSDFQIFGSILLGWLFYNLVVLLPVFVVHEMSHAIACMHYGGTPGEMGTGLFYFSPFFYADTSDSWRMVKWKRVMVSLAGPLSTVMIGAVLAIIGLFVAPASERAFFLLPAFLCYYGTYLNLSPVIENDGYYALSDILNMPNLREDSFSYIRGLLGRLARSKKQTTQHLKTRKKLILLGFAVVAGGWLVLFLYTVTLLMFYLTQEAVGSAVIIGSGLLQARFDPLSGTVGVVLILYFVMLLAGYLLVVKTSVLKLRRRRLKLETIHDKFVALFMPLPPSLPERLIREYVHGVRKTASKFSHSYSVEWQPPFCIVNLKMGRATESLEEIRTEMGKKEKVFQDHYADFVRRREEHFHRTVGVFSPGKQESTRLLTDLSREITSFSNSEAKSSTSNFILRQKKATVNFLNSVVSSMWTLEVTPEDYKRIQTSIFPALLAEDLSESNLHGDVEEFKKHVVLGLDNLSDLAAKLEKEAGSVHEKLGVYQATAFLEPIRGRLVFVGRTDELRHSTLKVARLFLIQNWSGYFDEVLKEANIGLAVARRSMNRSPSRHAISGLYDKELVMLKRNLDRFSSLRSALQSAIGRLESDYGTAMMARHDLATLINPEEGKMDVGYYAAVLSVSDANLSALKKRIGEFEEASMRLFEEFDKVKSLVDEEFNSRSGRLREHSKKYVIPYLGVVLVSAALAVGWLLNGVPATYAVAWILGANGGFGLAILYLDRSRYRPTKNYTPTFDFLETLLLSTTRSIYEVITSADLFA